jgi:PAS domain S-box-containing protein
MEWFLPLAKESPSYALVVGILIVIVKGCKWLGRTLFDDEKGVVSKIVAKHSEFLEQTARTGDRVAIAIMGHTDQIRALERRLEGAWSVRHSDPEVWDLLFVNNPIPMAMVSRDGTYLNVNQAMCRLTGYTSVELRAKTWQELTPADELPTDSASADDLALGNSDNYQLKKHLVKKDGSRVSVELNAFRYPRMGNFRHFFSFYLPEGFHQ